MIIQLIDEIGQEILRIVGKAPAVRRNTVAMIRVIILVFIVGLVLRSQSARKLQVVSGCCIGCRTFPIPLKFPMLCTLLFARYKGL